ncbi:Fe-S cluster assembly protein SufD [Pseudovibrio exalbescens]|uniref:Fe-S cluster assembly protein SufD n=1 Tax=Pseudovibrio exalbescens TaxID=197461 RepID=UPI002366173D|nr:Fe-S cluster assembly protein SufD [Pseudovibrio exalbescens]MDD7908864.1 Fe-S cluster assembly protein SufD [Pseudovibrio exalbescens]
MNAEVRVQETQAEASLIEQFAGLAKDQGGVSAETREKAFAEFKEAGLPHRRVEEWHYTDLRAKMRQAFAPAANAGEAVALPELLDDGATARIAIVDGYYRADLSSGVLPEGVTISPIAEGASLFPAKDAIISLNAAFQQEGVSIEVAEGVEVATAIEISHITTGAEKATYPRNRFVVGNGANVLIVERFLGEAGAVYQTNAATEIRVGDEASATFIKLQDESRKAQHLDSVALKIGAHADVNHFTLNAGSDLSRTQLFVEFEGEESNLGARGISVLGDTQHSDVTLFVDHAVPNCESRELYKSVIADKARSVFQGKIIVRPDAQKTDGQMMVQSLLLSEEAEMNAKPELEIFADDVQCAHGSTTGEIDEDLLFYLRARGIPEAEARKMLVLAFLAEAIEEIENERVVALLETQLRALLGSEE